MEATDTIYPIHRINVKQFHRFGSRYRQIKSVGDGFLSVTIEGVDIELDIGDLFRYQPKMFHARP